MQSLVSTAMLDMMPYRVEEKSKEGKERRTKDQKRTESIKAENEL